MAHRISPSRRPAPRGLSRALYGGVLVFVLLAASTARSIWTAWQARSGEARAAAVFELVQQRTPLRPTDAPGALAWLRLQFDRYAARLPDAARARAIHSLAMASEAVPPILSPVAAALRAVAPDGAARAPLEMGEAAGATDALRVERLVRRGGRTFVVSRRARLDRGHGGGAASDGFLAEAVVRIGAAAEALASALARSPLPAPDGAGPLRPVRIYAVGEDGTLVSLPWEAGVAAAEAERRLLGARPFLPTFAPEEFFFRPRAEPETDAYSGLYLDLGGRGLVATVLKPFAAIDGARGVIAVDIGFAIDWAGFAAAVEPPVEGAAIVAAPAELGPDADWGTLGARLPAGAGEPLARAMGSLGARAAERPSAAAPIRHAVVERAGAVTAFYVADGTWLVMLFPATAPAFPLAAVLLLAVVLGILLGGFEVNRRRADRGRRAALGAFEEKQNLLNTMQVPLVVVDPNTDVIASANRAAEAIGIRAGASFGDLVWPDPAARAHYERMQVATPEPRRAYGVPVRVAGPGGRAERRFALVRSVAVTAPIASLAADERHRLGVLFLVDPDADLALFSAEVEQAAGRRERQRLAGLLSHGVETLARVLEHTLRRAAGGGAGGPLTFAAWLAEYLERRLQVTAWLLDHWDAPAPAAHESVVDAAQARATLDRLVGVFEYVRGDRELRARLHWDNGSLSGEAAGPAVAVSMDWPDALLVTTPVRGGFGFFVGEVLANAVRHGRPGTTPTCRIAADRVRGEIGVEVRNAAGADVRRTGEPYGGIRMLEAMARLFDWRDLTFADEDGQFVVAWRMPASVRGAEGEAD
jgi:hypothetical protein